MQTAAFKSLINILSQDAVKKLETDCESDCTPWLEDSVLELSSKTPVDFTEEEEEEEMDS